MLNFSITFDPNCVYKKGLNENINVAKLMAENIVIYLLFIIEESIVPYARLEVFFFVDIDCFSSYHFIIQTSLIFPKFFFSVSSLTDCWKFYMQRFINRNLQFAVNLVFNCVPQILRLANHKNICHTFQINISISSHSCPRANRGFSETKKYVKLCKYFKMSI